MDDPSLWKLLIAAGLGLLIGLEREISGKDPGLRTFALICLGSCIFAIVSFTTISGDFKGDPGRIAAQVVTGIGFIGAGAIFRSPKGVSGLTTAALMWVTASIGLAVGFDKFRLAVEATLITLAIVVTFGVVHRVFRGGWSENPSEK